MCNRRTIELMNVKGGHESSLAGENLCAARGRSGGGGAGVLVEGDVPVPAINRKKWYTDKRQNDKRRKRQTSE